MVTLNEACRIAYEKREKLNAVYEISVDQAYDRITYWTIGFDYVDLDSYDQPFALHLSGRTLCLCIDKETGNEVEEEEFGWDEIPPGGPVPVPDEYYRVPWYEDQE